MSLRDEIDIEVMKSSIVEYFDGVEDWDEEKVDSMTDAEIETIYRELFID